jgi:hypothetical protein
MAFSQIAKPGSAFGPCKLACEHKDCKELQKIANGKCAICGDPIGFERNYCNRLEGIESPHPHVHLACAEEWVDAQRQAS